MTTTASSRASGQAPGRPFYITGGTLPSDASSYVERQADQELNDSLLRSEYCYVLNTRQMGKSSLMIRTAARLREQGVIPVVLDLTAVGQNLTPDQWYDGLLVSLGEPLGLEDELDDYWREHQRGGGMQRFVGALRHLVLPRLEGRETGRLVVFVDEIDAVRSLPFSADEFFAGVRECYNRRATDPAFERLAFCLIGVATPADLIADSRISPFNIGRRIVLADFTTQEAAPLAQGLGPGGRELLARVLYWTGGHPYMTQRLCRTVAEEAGRQPGGATAADVDRLCAQLFLTKAARDTDDNLAFVRQRLLRSEADLASLLDLYTKVRMGRRVPDDETNPLCTVLRLSGVVREQGGLLKVRNRIYDSVFDRDWIVAHMPDAEVRRQKVAYRRGVWRAAMVATVFIAALGALALFAFGQKALAEAKTIEAQNNATIAEAQKKQAEAATKKAEDAFQQLAVAAANLQKQKDRADREAHHARVAQSNEKIQREQAEEQADEARRQKQVALEQKQEADVARRREKIQRQAAEHAQTIAEEKTEESRHSLVRLNVATGQRLAQDGNPIDATLFLAKARSLENRDKQRDFVHETRLADVLDRLPRLARLWPENRGMARTSRAKPAAPYVASFGFAGPGAVLQEESPTETGGGGAATARGPVLSLWDAPTNRTLPLTRPGELPRRTSIAAVAPGGRAILIALPPSSAADRSDGGPAVRVWKVNPRGNASPLSAPIGLGKGVEIREACLSADGRRVAIRDSVNRVRAFNAATGEVLVDLKVSPYAEGPGLSADGRVLAVTQGVLEAYWPDTIHVWDIEASRRLCAPLRTQKKIHALGLSPDGSRLVAGTSDNSYLFTLGSLLNPAAAGGGASLPNASPPVECRSRWTVGVAFRPDGKAFAVGNSAGDVFTFDALTGEPREAMTIYDVATSRPLPAHKSDVTCLAYSPDGSKLLTGSMDQTARLWDANLGVPVSPPLRHATGVVWAAFDPDGRFILSQDLVGERRLWDLYQAPPSGRMFAFMEASDYVGEVEFSPDGRLVASIQQNGRVQVCDATTGAALSPMLAGRRFGDGGKPVRFLTFSPDSHRIASLGPDGAGRVWDAYTGQECFPPLRHPAGKAISRVLFAPDGRRLYTAGEDGLIVTWDSRSGKAIGEPLRNDPPVRDIALSPDGRWLALTQRAGAGAWDLQARRFVPMGDVEGWLPGDRLAFRPDGQAVLCWGWEVVPSSARRRAALGHHLAVVWQVPNGKVLATMPHAEWIIDAAYSPDGKQIATAMFGGKAFLWDAKTGKPTTPPFSHRGEVRAVRFSADGTLVVTASLDATVRLWDAATGELVAERSDEREVTACTCVAVSPRGTRQVAAGGWMGATLWELPQSPGTDKETRLLARVLSCSEVNPRFGAVPADRGDITDSWDELCLRKASYVARPLMGKSEALWRTARRQFEQHQGDGMDQTLTALLAQTPDDPKALLERALNSVRLGRFAAAANDLDRFAAVRRDPAALPDERSSLRAAAGDIAGYQRLCREIFPLVVERFRGTAYGPLRFATYGPGALDSSGYDRAIRLLEETLERGAGDRGTQTAWIGLLYRAGRYDDAVAQLERSEGADRALPAVTLLFGAMAYAKLGNAEAARHCMTLAGDWIRTNGGSLWNFPDVLEVTILSREAPQVLRDVGIDVQPLPGLN